jgi:hypothetical protein
MRHCRKLFLPNPVARISCGPASSWAATPTVIRSWIDTPNWTQPNHYAQANLETKRKAPWKREADLLAWLDFL